MWEAAKLVHHRGTSHSATLGGGKSELNILRVRCQNAEEFREHYKNDEPHGALFCPTTTELDPGTPVVVELVCKALPNRVLIRGTVVSWRPSVPRLRVRAGAVVKFDAEEAAKRDFILETLGGARKPPPKRKHARIPVGWPAKMRIDSELQVNEGELREISVVGALVHCGVQPPLETEVVLQVVPPGGMTPMELSGRVLYHAGPGLTGIKFIFREGGGSRRLRELVRRFKIS